jgi:hypothetical protein
MCEGRAVGNQAREKLVLSHDNLQRLAQIVSRNSQERRKEVVVDNATPHRNR